MPDPLPTRYRKRPVVIEAIPVRHALDFDSVNWGSLPAWLRKAHHDGRVTFARDAIFVNTLEGQMCANLADWLICGVQGELYPCKPDIFEATYEPVEASDA